MISSANITSFWQNTRTFSQILRTFDLFHNFWCISNQVSTFSVSKKLQTYQTKSSIWEWNSFGSSVYTCRIRRKLDYGNILTVEERISWGQQDRRKLLHTLASVNLSRNLVSSPIERTTGNWSKLACTDMQPKSQCSDSHMTSTTVLLEKKSDSWSDWC